MGSYNKEYEKYYRKINKTRKTSPNHEVNFKTKGSYKRREKDSSKEDACQAHILHDYQHRLAKVHFNVLLLHSWALVPTLPPPQ